MHIAPRLLHHYKRVSRLLDRLDPEGKPWAIASPGSAEPRGDIIVFPGSFNPPTVAHLAMLREARKFANQRGGHWRVYAALSKQIVDKEAVERMTLLDRAVLLERILKNHVKGAGLLLLNRGLYVEQAEAIRAAFPGVRELYFLLGFDKIVQILDPRYYADRNAALNELFHLACLLVAPRGASGEGELRERLAQPENRPFARYIQPLPLAAKYRDISSTQVRQVQKALLSALPVEARDFITGVDVYAERTQALQKLLSCSYAEKPIC